MNENKFSDSVRKKSNKQLIDILTNKEEYNPELVSAAEIELRNRRNKTTVDNIKENLWRSRDAIKSSQKHIKNSKSLQSTGKTIRKTFGIIFIIIGVPLFFFSLTSVIFPGPNTFVPVVVFLLFIGILFLFLGIKML
ncbi:MAG: hypothetical protein ACOC22_04195 [bacterium]